MGTKQAKFDNEYYFEKFAPIVTKMYRLERKENLKLNFKNFIEEEEFKYSQLNEESSDVCYELLLGTKMNRFNKTETCSTNNDCLSYYTATNASRYYLTHQLLFFIIAKQVNSFLN